MLNENRRTVIETTILAAPIRPALPPPSFQLAHFVEEAVSQGCVNQSRSSKTNLKIQAERLWEIES